MRTIKRTFANLNKSTLFLGKAGENLVTRLEIDVSKELSEYANPSFDLILSMPSDNEPYPVLATLSGSKLIYNFTENDLSKAGNGQIEALVAGASGEVLKSTTAKTVIEPSINPNTYPGPIQRFLEQLENNVRNIVMQYNIEVVDALPSTARAGKIVYLIGSGFYYYSDGQWNSISSGGSAESDIIVARSLSDLENIASGKIVFAPQTIEESGETFDAGWYRKDDQNFVLVSKLITAEEKTHFNASYQKALELSEYGTIEHEDESISPAFENNELALKSSVDSVSASVSEIEQRIDNLVPSDTLVHLALGTTYASLSVRADWASVPCYCHGDNPVVCYLASEEDTIGGYAACEIRLQYNKDYQTGMPVAMLRVTTGGSMYMCYAAQYHDMAQTYASGWYDANGTRLDSAPTLTNMRFDFLTVDVGEEITDFTDLSGKALSALETLSRMVNVSAAAMGSLGVVENGVQRLTHAPQAGRRYAFETNRDITFPVPSVSWTDREQDFWLDLICTGSIALTFSDDICYEDGNNIDTTSGTHRLHFYVPAGSDTWTVAETESVPLVTEDLIPPYAIPFRNCTVDQIRAILKYGYSNANGDWCVRINGEEVVFFHVGDTRTVTLTTGQEVTMRIIGIHHDDLPNGGKAALTCDFVELVSVDTFQMDVKSRYDASNMRVAARSVASLFPDWLSSLCVAAHKVCHYFSNSDALDSTSTYADDKTWMLGIGEVGLRTIADEPCYTVFTDNQSRIRYDPDGISTKWPLRVGRNYNSVTGVGANGSNDGYMSNNENVSIIAIGFCLNVN